MNMNNTAMENVEIFLATLSLVGNVIAVIGNILVCLTIYKTSRLRTHTNVFIAAMAIIGLLFAVFVGPAITVTLFAGRKWVFGQYFCSFHGFMSLFIEFATLHTIALTAFNRHCRMLKIQLYRKIFQSRRRSCAILILVWSAQIAFILVFSLPWLAKFKFSHKRAGCVLEFRGKRGELTYSVIKTIFYFCATNIIVVYCYTKVFLNIRNHSRKISCALRTSDRVNIEEVKITRTVLAVVLFFLVCWIPEYIISIIIRVNPEHLHRFAHRAVVFFLFLSCSLNPWVYAATNREFRTEFKRRLMCKERSHRLEDTEPPQRTSNIELRLVNQNRVHALYSNESS